MKSRPTIALACILKNEAINLGPFLESFGGCFDEIHFTDTGSTDNSVEILKSEKARELAGCPVYVHHFEWCDDFAKARQFSFDQVPKHIDFIMWADLDDSLSSKEEFLHFRDHTMHCADMWLAMYNYSFKDGVPVCSFLRERIIRNGLGYKWEFFIHEGIVGIIDKKTATQATRAFTINHRRTEED